MITPQRLGIAAIYIPTNVHSVSRHRHTPDVPSRNMISGVNMPAKF